jgi:hypothetical protein
MGSDLSATPHPAPAGVTVMPGLVPGIHVFCFFDQNVDGRDKPGHDERRQLTLSPPRG